MYVCSIHYIQYICMHNTVYVIHNYIVCVVHVCTRYYVSMDTVYMLNVSIEADVCVACVLATNH